MFEEFQPGSTIMLIDSSGVLVRCFEGYSQPHLLRPSAYNGRVMDVAALHGYLAYTRKLYEGNEFECDAVVHVMDPPGGSHYRYSMFPEYKAGRRDNDPLLEAQNNLLPKMLHAFGERYLRKRGIEADDLIGTLAVQAAALGHHVLMMSSDKDLMQLVRDASEDHPGSITQARYVPQPGGIGKIHATYEEADVLNYKKIGVRPDQVADFLALVGDDADGIPGVDKVGPSTAAKWLAEYGDLSTLMTNADKITGKVGENLRAALPNLPLYQKLTNVLRDLPGLGIPVRPQPTQEECDAMRATLQLPPVFPKTFEFASRMGPQVRRNDSAPAPVQLHDEGLKPASSDPLAGFDTAPGDSFDDPLAGLDGGTTPSSDPFLPPEESESTPAAPAPSLGLGRPRALR